MQTEDLPLQQRIARRGDKIQRDDLLLLRQQQGRRLLVVRCCRRGDEDVFRRPSLSDRCGFFSSMFCSRKRRRGGRCFDNDE